MCAFISYPSSTEHNVWFNSSSLVQIEFSLTVNCNSAAGYMLSAPLENPGPKFQDFGKRILDISKKKKKN